MSAAAAELQRRIGEMSAELLAVLAAEQAPPPPGPAYLSINDFAQRLHVHPKTVRRMIKKGMPARRPRPSVVRVPVAAAEAWIAGAPERAPLAQGPSRR